MWPKQIHRFERWFDLPNELSLACEECGQKGLTFRSSDMVDDQGTIVANYECKGLVFIDGEQYFCGHIQKVEV